jgi:hypothetical protein
MFRACCEVLERGGAIGIFPEGTSRDEPRVERLKTGTARIALEAEAAHDFRLGVRVVPVGIHFETPRRFRSRVLLRAGVPLVPGTYAERYREDPRRAVEEFTSHLHAALADQVVHLEHLSWGLWSWTSKPCTGKSFDLAKSRSREAGSRAKPSWPGNRQGGESLETHDPGASGLCRLTLRSTGDSVRSWGA